MKQINHKTIIQFIKQEFVLCIATILAIVSCAFVPISKKYLDYIDFRVLSLLFCLMLIVAGFRSIGFFDVLSEKLFHFTHSIRSTVMVFLLLCFFGSMLITNDVALILFVPFSIFTLKKILSPHQFILLIILETLAANLGSMFTPIGNPQNLYIFSTYEMDLFSFFKTMFPYTAVSFLLLLASVFYFPKTVISEHQIQHPKTNLKKYAFRYVCFTALFFITLTTVLRITPFWLTLIICIFITFFINRKLFSMVDYCLLLTFIALFIFVGNMGQIPWIQNTMGTLVSGNEIPVSIALSQGISNVPATLLLSQFTENGGKLLVGVNLGGLGTLIASMASLISYKFYVKEKESRGFTYFLLFSLLNVGFLTTLLLFC